MAQTAEQPVVQRFIAKACFRGQPYHPHQRRPARALEDRDPVVTLALGAKARHQLARERIALERVAVRMALGRPAWRRECGGNAGKREAAVRLGVGRPGPLPAHAVGSQGRVQVVRERANAEQGGVAVRLKHIGGAVAFGIADLELPAGPAHLEGLRIVGRRRQRAGGRQLGDESGCHAILDKLTIANRLSRLVLAAMASQTKKPVTRTGFFIDTRLRRAWSDYF